MKPLPNHSDKELKKSKVKAAKIGSQGNESFAKEPPQAEEGTRQGKLALGKDSPDFSMLKIGVLALQGAFAKHIEMVMKLGASGVLVKKPEDLADIDALIIPGGESTTMLLQIKFIDLFPALLSFSEKKPIFGTCAGLILMSKQVEKNQAKDLLKALDISVERNAFGRQVESFKADIQVKLPSTSSFAYPAIFIRAPRIKQTGAKVSVLADFEGEPVLVQQGHHLGSSFHPELTDDLRIHSYFLMQVKKAKGL